MGKKKQGVTRRRFLEQVGLAGGSAALYETGVQTEQVCNFDEVRAREFFGCDPGACAPGFMLSCAPPTVQSTNRKIAAKSTKTARAVAVRATFWQSSKTGAKL